MTASTAQRFDWQIEQFDLNRYLARIRHPAVPTPSRSALGSLARAHVLAIPFENVDVMLGRHRGIGPEAIMDKLVGRERGGYCYEHGALFAAVAEQLGFEVVRLSSRIQPHKVGPRTHMCLVVRAEGARYLVDVGYGGGMLEPMPLRDGVEMSQAGWLHRLAEQDGVWTLSKHTEAGWEPLHAFTEEPRRPVDYEVGHHYVSTHPASRLAGQLVVLRLADGLSRRLVGNRLSVEHVNGHVQHTRIKAEQLADTLRGLDIVLTDDEHAALLASQWYRPA